jgi:hypothetical protein
MSNIPIILINRDRLSCTERLLDHLLLLGYSNLYILDMDSSYPPLIEFYSRRASDFTLIMQQNTGHKTLWEKGILRNLFADNEWVAVTDSDIELSPDTPRGFIEQMITVAKDFRIDKVGLSIVYDDITNPVLKDIITPIESQYWIHHMQHKWHNVYMAPTDTTFCIVRPKLPFTYTALRIADWPIRHIDWYSNWDKLTDEEQYYFDHADEQISTTKQHYTKWISEKA